jgi:protein-S-isoprenylcysteine O-methyltransferase Ste14
VVWGVDSFLLKWTTFLSASTSLALRLLVGLFLAVFGVYMTWVSHETVFSEEGQQGLIDWGVYGLCRHPMYLGIVSLFLGMSFATFSVAAFLISVALFVLYDRFTAYEEERLVEALGDEYREYQRRVPKWFPKFW